VGRETKRIKRADFIRGMLGKRKEKERDIEREKCGGKKY